MKVLPDAGLAFVYMDIILGGLYVGPRMLFGRASLPAEPQSTQFPWEPGPIHDYSCNLAGKESGKGNIQKDWASQERWMGWIFI